MVESWWQVADVGRTLVELSRWRRIGRMWQTIGRRWQRAGGRWQTLAVLEKLLWMVNNRFEVAIEGYKRKIVSE